MRTFLMYLLWVAMITAICFIIANAAECKHSGNHAMKVIHHPDDYAMKVIRNPHDLVV